MFGFLTRAALAAVVVVAPAAMAQVQVDPELPRYQPTAGVSGNITSVGSDSLNNLMTLWAEEFRKFYPNVGIEIEGKGSSTAPTALIQGTAQFGPMSRPMRGSEVDNFQQRYGYPPTAMQVGVDSLAVFVHKDNPIQGLSLEQVRQIFSVDGPEMTWGDVGLTGEWANRRIALYGRNSASGTYGFFKEVALGNSDFKPTVNEQPGSSSVVQGVASDRFAIGYSGIGYATADVRAVPLSQRTGQRAYAAEAQHAYSGRYPLARFLMIYVNVRPGDEPAPAVREFIRMVMSHEGQQVVVRDGYFPVPKAIADQTLRATGVVRD